MKHTIYTLLCDVGKDSLNLCSGVVFPTTKKGLFIFGRRKQKKKKKLVSRI
jgi:hypothetical protein